MTIPVVFLSLLFCTFLVSGVVIIYPEKKPHIKIDIDLRFDLAYTEDGWNSTLYSNYWLTNGVTSNGGLNDTAEWVTVDVGKGENLTFLFHYVKNNLTLEMRYLLQPSDHFGNKSTIKDPIEVVFTGTDLGVKKGSNEAFYCQTLTTNHFREVKKHSYQNLTLTMEVSLAKMQAFGGLKHGDFDKYQECPVDATPPVGNYSIKSKKDYCVKMQGAFQLAIDYEALIDNKTKRMTSLIVLPQGITQNVTCSKKGAQWLPISFYHDDFKLTFKMNKSADSTYKVYIYNMSLEYVTKPVLFAHINPKYANKHVVVNLDGSDRLFRYTKGEYFKCNSNETFSLKKGDQKAKLFISSFRYIAYHEGTANPSLDGKNYEQCPDDVKVSNIVPIAVGAALAALVLIVLIAYLIGRRKSHKGYESV